MTPDKTILWQGYEVKGGKPLYKLNMPNNLNDPNSSTLTHDARPKPILTDSRNTHLDHLITRSIFIPRNKPIYIHTLSGPPASSVGERRRKRGSERAHFETFIGVISVDEYRPCLVSLFCLF